MKATIFESLWGARRMLPVLFVAVAFGALASNHSAFAAVEDIQWRVSQNEPVAEYFPNEYDLRYPKLLEFNGMVENTSGLNGSLTMFFDYIDPADESGTGVVYTSPVTIDVREFSTVSVTVTEMIPFCPPQVSLHMRGAGSPLFEVRGTFTHECQVPEPATTVAAGLGLMTLGMVTRRRR